jgi:hypothetical protein
MFATLLLSILPTHLELSAPFPAVRFDAPTIQTIAPGVESGEYDLVTDMGPIIVHVIAVAPHAPQVRVNSVLADDALTSAGETISSMARRTGAVAGINADYFDIGNTNRPTNIVVKNGILMRSPRKRYALVIANDGLPQIIETNFTGELAFAAGTVPLDAIDQMPPPGGGVALLTPAFGPVDPLENLTLVGLTPTNGTPPFATYRVTGILDNAIREPAGYYAAIGPEAYGLTGVPNAGETIAASGDLAPVPLADVMAAVGGGPLILSNGSWYDDPDGPNGGEYAQRIPASGAAIDSDGTLYLIEVDGREPERSVGVTRPEFAVLMRALGAVRGMAFDGGGSSAIVTRAPGDVSALLANAPSDGHERKVADGIFVYSTAPIGPPAQLLAQPQVVRAMPGASVDLRIASADAAEHVVNDPAPIDARVEPSTLGMFRDGSFLASRAGDGEIVAHAGALVLHIPVHVSSDPARLAILPHDPSVAQDGRLTLHVQAYDAQGYAIALPAALPWRAVGGSIDASGTLVVTKNDALVSLLLGDHLVNARVTVGFHDIPLTATPAFMTAPRGGEGSVGPGPDCPACTQLQYALGPQERAAYLVTQATLPERSVAIAFDVFDDGNGEQLKVALRNAINEEVLLPAGTMEHRGLEHVEVRLPSGLAQPARLVALYVIGSNAKVSIQGTIAIQNLRAVVAGSETNRP